MKVNGISKEQLHEIAEEMGITIDSSETGKRVIWINFKLRPKTGSDRYRRCYETIWGSINNSKIETRRTSACCSHAFFDLIEKVFKINNSARFRSMVHNFDGEEDFRKKVTRDEDYWGKKSGNIRTTNFGYQKKSYCNCSEIEEAKRLSKKIEEDFRNETEEELFHD